MANGNIENSKNNLSNYWWNRAETLHSSAIHLYERHGHPINLNDPCFLLAGLSLEVVAKAILVKQHQKFDEQKFSHHIISKILETIGIQLSESQLATVRFFEESVIWLSKYPEPKLQQIANQKILKLQMVVGGPGILGKATKGDPGKWPTKENYISIWQAIASVYWETPTENSNEFGYKLRGLERPW